VMPIITDPLGAAADAGGWVADTVDAALDYLTGGCKNPPVEEYFANTFAANVSNVAYGDAADGKGVVQKDYEHWSESLYNKCVEFFDKCNSSNYTARRQCEAMRHGTEQWDGNGWMVGRGYYQLVRARGFEYEITRALYEKAGGLHEQASDQAKAKAASFPKQLKEILSGMTLASDTAMEEKSVKEQIGHVDKALGIYYGSLQKDKGLPGLNQKASFAGGSIGFLMSQRAQEVGKEGNGKAPAAALPRARAQTLAQEYIDAFNPVQMAADAMEGTYAKRLRSHLTGQGCIAVGDIFTCVKPEAQEICVKAKDVVKPSPTCELDWKKAAQLMLKENNAACTMTDAAKATFSCETLAASKSCDKVMDVLGQGSAKLCSLNMDKLMADNSCVKQPNKYVCDTVKATDVCEDAAKYIGKDAEDAEKFCDINIDKAMAKIKECSASSSGSGQTVLKNYLCTTYWAQDDCKAIYLEANSKNDSNLYCKVDVVAADKAAGERSVGVLSTPANACKAQGAVVTCPRDVQLARCKKEPYLKGCQLQRTPQYDSLVKLAQLIRADLTQGLNKKAGAATASSGMQPIGVATTLPNAPSQPAKLAVGAVQPPPAAGAPQVGAGKAVAPQVQSNLPSSSAAASSLVNANFQQSKASGKDISPITFYPGDDPLFFDAVTQIPPPGYLFEVLRTYYPNLPNISLCKGGEQADPDGVDQLMLCAPGLSDAFNKFIEEKSKEVNDKMKTAPPGGGKGPAAVISARVDARINPGDVAKGGNDLAVRGQAAGAGVMNAGAVQLGSVQTIANQRGLAANAGAPAAGAGAGAGTRVMGMPAAPSMGAPIGAQAGGLSTQQLGNPSGLGANLPGSAGALPAGAGGTQQAMMGQVAPPPPPGAPPPPAGGTAPLGAGATLRGLPTAPVLSPTAPVVIAAASTPHQQLTAANCTATTAPRGLAVTTAPVDGAYTCPAGAAQTLCEGFLRSQPLLVKRCTQALSALPVSPIAR
jgi:hypothetical protein